MKECSFIDSKRGQLEFFAGTDRWIDRGKNIPQIAMMALMC